MAYDSTGVMTMFPIYLARLKADADTRESFDIGVAQNEANLNQNFDTIYAKLVELEDYLASQE